MTNYTLFFGNTSPHHIRYTLVTVDNADYDKVIPLSSDILNASVAPDDFISRPGQIYRSRVLITIGPNVAGESHTNPDGSGWSRNPYFSFRLKVTVDGSEAPEAEDQIAVIKLVQHAFPDPEHAGQSQFSMDTRIGYYHEARRGAASQPYCAELRRWHPGTLLCHTSSSRRHVI